MIMKLLLATVAAVITGTVCFGQAVMRCGSVEEPRPEIEALIESALPAGW